MFKPVKHSMTRVYTHLLPTELQQVSQRWLGTLPAWQQPRSCPNPLQRLPHSCMHMSTKKLWVSEKGLVHVAAPHVEMDGCLTTPSMKQSVAAYANS